MLMKHSHAYAPMYITFFSQYQPNTRMMRRIMQKQVNTVTISEGDLIAQIVTIIEWKSMTLQKFSTISFVIDIILSFSNFWQSFISSTVSGLALTFFFGSAGFFFGGGFFFPLGSVFCSSYLTSSGSCWTSSCLQL